MKKYNCIVVLNDDKTEFLFCKRKKEPFKDRYNFVGGKIEDGDDGCRGGWINDANGYTKADLS